MEAETPVDLLLGLSPDENETFIPYLIGYTLAVARDNLFENSLNLGNVTYETRRMSDEEIADMAQVSPDGTRPKEIVKPSNKLVSLFLLI